jgi:hypothetical protein
MAFISQSLIFISQLCQLLKAFVIGHQSFFAVAESRYEGKLITALKELKSQAMQPAAANLWID